MIISTIFQDFPKMIDFAHFNSHFHPVHHLPPIFLDTYSKIRDYSSFTFMNLFYMKINSIY